MYALKENDQAYAGKTAAEISALRLSILSTLDKIPEEILPFIKEELETGMEPVLVAITAVMLRKMLYKSEWMAVSLVSALYNMRMKDRVVCVTAGEETTATGEILKSLRWLGGSAKPSLHALESLITGNERLYSITMLDEIQKTIAAIRANSGSEAKCCTYPYNHLVLNKRLPAASIILEDQDGIQYSFQQYLWQKITAVAFFYTRCDNPLKCSLTITKLARLQELKTIQLAAISYDQIYDTPQRLKAYGASRGFHGQLFRVQAGFDKLLECLDLGVNFNDGVVNRHAVELFVFGRNGRLLKAFRRTAIDTQEIQQYLNSVNRRGLQRLKQPFGIIPSLLIVALPKCPLCFAAWFSLLGITGTTLIKYTPYVVPALCLLLGVDVYIAYRFSRRDGNFLPFICAFAGSLMVIFFTCFYPYKPLAIAGIIGIAAETFNRLLKKNIKSNS